MSMDYDTSKIIAVASALDSSLKSAIGEKLAKPETAGEANQVLTSDGNGGQVWAAIGQGDITVDSTLSVAGSAADAKAAGDEISDLKSAIEQFEDGYAPGETIHLNLLDSLEPTSTTQYYGLSNAGVLGLYTAPTATYNSYIVPVKQNQLYTASNLIRYIIPLDSNQTPLVEKSGVIQNESSIDTTSYPNTEYLAISINNQTYDMNTFALSEGSTASREVITTSPTLPGWAEEPIENLQEQIDDLDVKPKKNKVYMLMDTSFSEEKSFPEFLTSAKGKSLHIVVNPSSFTSVTVGLKNSNRAIFYAQVTDTSINLYDYGYGTNERTTTYSHGLTIENNLAIDVYANENTQLYYVKIASNGSEYTTTASFSVTHYGLAYPYATMEGSATFVQFSAVVDAIARPIWLFGDSYTGTNNTARWAYYLVNREQDSRVMMDGYGGESTTGSLTSLQTLIECGVPDYIVWCLGLNDGSDSGTTPNTSWMNGIESVIAICEENHVTPIFATIPTVPGTNNEGKNKWVRESGYQFIDFANAVGASDQGVWFEDMLSTDNVHPTVTGAISLYYAALAGCPQFSQK